MDERRDQFVDEFAIKVDAFLEFEKTQSPHRYPDPGSGGFATREDKILDALQAQVQVNTMLSEAIAALEREIRGG